MVISKKDVFNVVKKCLGIENIKSSSVEEIYNTDLSDFGMDSIKFIQFVVELEETFNCQIPSDKIFISEMNTINKIYAIIQQC